MILTIESIYKSFGDVNALSNISFSVSSGTVLMVLGPNGAGKSVLLQILAGVTAPDKGDVWVGDASILNRSQKIKYDIGYVSEEPDLIPNMTGLEYLHLVGSLFGMSEIRRRTRINELFAHFSLQGIGNTYINQYSRANKQKFAFMASVLAEPKILLLDDVMSGMDYFSRESVSGLIKTHVEHQGIVVYCTHEFSVVNELSDTYLFLNQGHVIANDTLSNLKGDVGEACVDLGVVYSTLFEKSVSRSIEI